MTITPLIIISLCIIVLYNTGSVLYSTIQYSNTHNTLDTLIYSSKYMTIMNKILLCMITLYNTYNTTQQYINVNK